MKIAYHLPSLATIYAYRTIYNGFRNAFLDMGHEFRPFTADDRLEPYLEEYQPDIFLTASHFYYKKFLNFEVLKKYRQKGMSVFVKIDFWNSPFDQTLRVNEAKSLKDDQDTVRLIKEGLYGDYFYHVVEQGDERMAGFEEVTRYPYHTIPLAADKIILKPQFQKRFEADISFIGTNLPQKRDFFREYVFPLKRKYDLRLYGQDWTWFDRCLGLIQKAGQLYNIPLIRSLQKPKLQLSDEPAIYTSSRVSINVHEEYQRRYGGDCNERTFKIPLSGGFEICDDVACIRKYFKEGEEIIIARNSEEWFEKIGHFLKHPEERLKIIEAGQKKVLSEHTYHNRAQQILDIYSSGRR